MQTLRPRLAAAAILAAVAFGLYYTTLLPGQDLGDTAAFQAAAGRDDISPRDGYPLYFALVGTFTRHLSTEPARAANLASAAAAAVAVGLVVLAGSALAGSLLGGVVAGLLLAGSYTFWSQAIIAEVYSLHLLCTTASLLALLHWYRRPSDLRLALFFSCYGLGFGNHLMMVLLMPGFALFLLLSAPGGPRSMLRPRVLALAASIAALCALQYAWNLRTLLAEPHHGSTLDLVRNFWFDVTKSDWRATMVEGTVSGSLAQRLRMYWFDVRQQFGVPGITAAAVGVTWLFRRDWRLGALLSTLWVANWWFAFTYNVGDVHVFFIPSHWATALSAGCAAAACGALAGLEARPGRPEGSDARVDSGSLEGPNGPEASRSLETCRTNSVAAPVGPPGGSAATAALTSGWKAGRTSQMTGRVRVALGSVAAAVMLAYPVWRVYDTYPAVDRSGERDSTAFFDRLTAGLDGDREIVGTDLNWQLHNGFEYYAQRTRRDIVVFDVSYALLHFPALLESNTALGRSMVLTEGAADMVRQLYGRLFEIERDPRLHVPSLAEQVAAVPKGTPYVLTVMEGDASATFDREDLAAASALLGLSPRQVPGGRYAVAAGLVGEEPWAGRSRPAPFRVRRWLGGVDVDIRFESFLPYDTIRRAGFGCVVANRRRVMTIDRGVSFVALSADGRAVVRAWSGGLFAPQPRYLVTPGR